jgi:PAS domain S-box-containing protein
VAILLDFTTGQNLNFLEIAGLEKIPWLGEMVSSPVGRSNPAMFVGQLSSLMLVVFVVDSAISAWRRGIRQRALLVGCSIVFFLVAASIQAALIVWGHRPWPVTVSLFYLGIILAMSYELGGEVLRAARLDRDLRRSAEQLSLAAEAVNLGLWYSQSGQGEFSANDQWRSLFGFAKADQIYIEDFLQRLHPDDRDKARESIAQAFRGDGSYQTEHRVLLANGEIRWIACQGRVNFDGHGQPGRFQGISMDVTRLKQADLEEQQHRNEVAHLLRVASLGELSSALAHELNQPLAAILNNAHAAQLLLAEKNHDLDEVHEILHDILTDNRRASEIIQRLRNLYKKSEFQPESLDANQLIEEVLKLMKFDLRARSVSVVACLTPGLPRIRGDRVQLQQVLINLVLNATDAMAQAAGGIRTLTPSSSVDPDGGVRISVADSGVGIAPGTEEQIFQPYHTTKPQGLGLGLSVSRSIMRAHGGHLWAENGASGGAIFHFIVPAWSDNTEGKSGDWGSKLIDPQPNQTAH